MSTRINPRVPLSNLTRTAVNISRFTLKGEVISRQRGLLDRIRNNGNLPSSLASDYTCTRQLKFQVLGKEYKMDMEKARTIGTSPNDDLPINQKVLSKAINVVIKESDVELSMTRDDQTELVVRGKQSVLVLRHDEENTGKHRIYVLHERNEPAYQVNGGINILERESLNGTTYTADELSAPRDKFEIKELRQFSGEGFILKPNDTIFVALGCKKGIDKSLIWLPIIFDPQEPSPVNKEPLPDEEQIQHSHVIVAPQTALPIERAALSTRQPEIDRGFQMKQSINVDELLTRVETRKRTSFIDLVYEYHGEELRDNIIEMANQAYPAKNRGRSEEAFQEDMALNWLLKVEAFKLITAEHNYEEVSGVGRYEDVAILAVSQNGSLVEIYRFPHAKSRVRELTNDYLPELAGKLDLFFTEFHGDLLFKPNIEDTINERMEDPDQRDKLLKMYRSRNIHYMRIADRVDVRTKQDQGGVGWINNDIKKGEILDTTKITTSPIILLATNPDLYKLQSQMVSKAVSLSFIAIDRKTNMSWDL